MCQTAVEAHKDVPALWKSLLTLMITNQNDTGVIKDTLIEAEKCLPKKVWKVRKKHF